MSDYNKIISTINSVSSSYSYSPDPANLICIDSSNNRIGINTLNPAEAIDISGGNIRANDFIVLGNIIPLLDISSNLGSSLKRWSNIFVNDLSVNRINGQAYTGGSAINLSSISGNIIPLLDVSYNLGSSLNRWSNAYIRDISVTNIDVSGNLNPLIANSSSLGSSSKYWSTAYIRDVSVTNIDVSGNLNPLIANRSSLGSAFKSWSTAYIRDVSVTNIDVSGNIVPLLDVSSNLGSSLKRWSNIFVNDLSVNRINGQAYTGGSAINLSSISGNIIPSLTNTFNLGSTSNYWNNAYINNLRLSNRAYQEISGDISWSAVNGYYGLAKDAYPGLNPLSSGIKAVRTWTSRTVPSGAWNSVCWSPQRMLFVAVSIHTISVITSNDGISWINRNSTAQAGEWAAVCWSPQLTLFVAVSGTGTTMWSSDGITWTYGTSTYGTSFSTATWNGVCWSPEMGLFVAVGSVGTDNRVITSNNGKTWNRETGIPNSTWRAVAWSPELKIFVAVSSGNEANYAMISSNGINWGVQNNGTFASVWNAICWSSQLGIFVAVSDTGSTMTYNGVNWIRNSAIGVIRVVSWSPELKIFVYIDHDFQKIGYSLNGNDWTVTTVATSTNARCMCWSPELGIFVGLKSDSVVISSLKGRPPTSYNVFDSCFNRIDENGKWDFSNINVTSVLTVRDVGVTSDDRLKHNEVAIANGLTIIDKLNPKFYQKTFIMLDASYNGDLSGYSWNYEAGLIAQEVLQISDLSYVVSGGDYYEELINYYDTSINSYEVSKNLITQAYQLNYNSVFVYGLAAIKELHAKVKAQETTILSLQTSILSLQTAMLEQQTLINNIILAQSS